MNLEGGQADNPDVVSPELQARFRDEDTDLWVDAARSIGRLGLPALPFIERHLLDSSNIHSHRHAWCALATLLDSMPVSDVILFELPTGGEGQNRELVESNGSVTDIREWLERRLSQVVLHGLVLDEQTTLGQLDDFPFFQHFRESRLQEFGERKLKLDGNEKALLAISKQKDAWSNAGTPINSPLLKIKGKLPNDFWTVSSFVAGATPKLISSLNIPFEHFITGLAAIGALGDERIAFVSNLPRMLEQGEESCAGDFNPLEVLIDKLPRPNKKWAHWTNYLQNLLDLTEKVDRKILIQIHERVACMLSDDLRQVYGEWLDSKSEGAAITLARTASEVFCEELDWNELSEDRQMALAIYYMVMRRPDASNGSGRFNLEHRIDRIFQQIEKWRGRNKEIVLMLARLLKELLYQQLRRIKPKQDPLPVCERQIYRILTLVDDWNLRGTLPKDLATIASRALLKAYRYDSRSRSNSSYTSLFYTFLSAVPESRIIKEMLLYTQHDGIETQLRLLSTVLGRLESEDATAVTFEQYKSLTETIWPDPAHAEWRQAFDRLINVLSRREEGSVIGESEREVLRWLLEKRLRWEIARSAGFPSKLTSQFENEFEQEVDLAVSRESQDIERLILEIAANERLFDAEARIPAVLIETLRQTVPLLRALREKIRLLFPIVEREYISNSLRSLGQMLEKRFEALAAVVETQDETRAVKIIDCTTSNVIGDNDRRLVANWMLQRYMLRELVPKADWLIGKLLDWRFVLIWILLPYVITGLLHVLVVPGLDARSANLVLGAPFVLIIVLNLVFLALYLSKERQLPGGLPKASLLIPQMIGTLFLGIVQTFSSDESWGAAYLGDPLFRILKITIFLAVSYFFVRYVMVKGQSPKVEVLDAGRARSQRSSILKKRSLALLSLGLWQSFTLVGIFSVLEGGVMSGSNRADLVSIPVENLSLTAQEVGQFVPNMIPVLFGDPVWLTFYVLPWAILSWTIQLFFFSAIFERIMNRS